MKQVQTLHINRLKRNPWLPLVLLSVALTASSCGTKKGDYPAGPEGANETFETKGGIEAAAPAKQSFAFNAVSIGGVFLTGGGVYDLESGFVRGGGAFRSTRDITTGPLAGCKAGEGVRWDATAVLPSSGFKCSGLAEEPVKTVVTDGNTVVMQVDFYRQGDGNIDSFTAKMFVSAEDEDPAQDGIQNAWIQGVGCTEALVNLR